MNFLLDTCVLSETIKPKPDEGLVNWLTSQQESSLFVSALTLGELRKGIERLPSGKKKHDLFLWLARLCTAYSARFIDFDADCAMTWCEMTARAEKAGHSLHVIDSMIAATALQGGCALVTRNVADYANVDVRVINPWESK